jgi:hypothetical protein
VGLAGALRSKIGAVAAGGAVAFLAAGYFAASSWDSFNWDAATGAATAYGTLALALVTWSLVKSSNQDASETRRLAQLAEREQQARIRPFVYPWPETGWLREQWKGESLPFRNDGAGVALNVEVQIYWHPSNTALAAKTIAPGEATILFARSKVESWVDTWGLATYTDLMGRKWETRFTVTRPAGGQIVIQVCAYGLVDLLPQMSHPAGWELPDGHPRLGLPDD